MKESVGEGAMTIITITLVAGTVVAIGFIINMLLSNQNVRANCENNGYEYVGGVCKLPDGDCKKVNSDGICED